eukprot:5913903-Pleurochrysis_carterae.AAC.2
MSIHMGTTLSRLHQAQIRIRPGRTTARDRKNHSKRSQGTTARDRKGIVRRMFKSCAKMQPRKMTRKSRQACLARHDNVWVRA